MSSSCPVAGSQVRLAVDPSGVRDAQPEPRWVSFPAPSAASTADIVGTFCCYVHFLAGRWAADTWVSRRAGGVALTLRDAFELGRIATRCFAE